MERTPIVSLLLRASIVVLGLSWGSVAGAVINANSPELPPDQEDRCDQVRSQYVGADVHALFPNGVDLSQPRHF